MRVALAFDNGPTSSPNRVLEILDRYGARATFFDTVGTPLVFRAAIPRTEVYYPRD
jgi:hypothetical protein